jgi:hypothetical protein
MPPRPNARVLRDIKARQGVADNEISRRAYLYIARNQSLLAQVRYQAQLQLNAFGRYTPVLVVVNGHSPVRCQIDSTTPRLPACTCVRGIESTTHVVCACVWCMGGVEASTTRRLPEWVHARRSPLSECACAELS